MDQNDHAGALSYDITSITTPSDHMTNDQALRATDMSIISRPNQLYNLNPASAQDQSLFRFLNFVPPNVFPLFSSLKDPPALLNLRALLQTVSSLRI